MTKRALALLAVLILGVFMTRTANAQRPDAQPPVNAQQPAKLPQADSDQGAARVSFVHGDVSMQRGDTGETSAMTINTPLMAGDKISTGDGSRTEVQLDFANVLRLDERAQANLVTLSRSLIQIQLAQGLASYSTVRPSEADVEIDTPNVSVHPQRQGRYRIQVNGDGDTEVLVRDGEADVSTAQGSTQVHPGELITIQGIGDQAQYRVTNAPANDDWDQWNDDRDNTIASAQSYRNTNPYYTGSQDLDAYGAWSEVPDYGAVWTPTVPVGWAPYRAGRWVFEPYWGWTWVSFEPWGWAPYHYGRWFLNGAQWAWWPGTAYGGFRPVWAPAYVSFFGFGRGVGVGFGFGFGLGFGSVGWLPIGPGDFFHPWWGGFRGSFGVADIHDFNNVRGGFAPLRSGGFSNFRDLETNNRLRAGMSSMSAQGFGTGTEPVRGVSAESLRSARAMTGGLPISPTRASMRVSDRPVNSSAFSAHADQHFFSASTPRGASGGQGARGNLRSSQPSYRPPLNMNRPIVNENRRTYGGSNSASGGYRGGYPVTPSYRNAPGGRPSYGGGYRSSPSPSYRSVPAPSYRAPNGGSSRGGGGSRGGGSGGGGRRR